MWGPTRKAMSEKFGGMTRCRIALEVSTHSPWVSRLLSGLGHEVIVANPRQLKLIPESSRKSDPVDAQTLARLARIDPVLLRPIRHRSELAQMDLIVIRARAALVQSRSSLVNTARGLARQWANDYPKSTRSRSVWMTRRSVRTSAPGSAATPRLGGAADGEDQGSR